MKQYFCDSCGQQFGGPLDEVPITDEHGVTTMYDLCAPCRKILNDTQTDVQQSFANSMMKPDEILSNYASTIAPIGKGIKNEQ